MNKQQEKWLVPELRFQEFQKNGEWRPLKLSELSDRITEKVGEKRLTTVSITAGEGFVSQIEKFSRDISGKQYKNYIRLRRGEYSYNKGNSKRFAQGCVYKLKEFEEVAAPSAFISFRFKAPFVADFFHGYFESNAHGKQLLRYITSGARSDGLLNIKVEDFFGIILPTPEEKSEQQKIADCLSSIDELVIAQSQKLQALKSHKKGLMQLLFPSEGETVPKLRFPEFRNTEEWGEYLLDEVATFLKGKGISKSEVAVDGKLPCIRYGQLYTIYGETIDEVVSHTNVSADNLVLSQSNDVIIPASGETQLDIATASCVKKSGIALGGDLNVIRSNHNGVFLSYYFNGAKKKSIAQMAQGVVVIHLYSSQLKKLQMNLPSIQEQQKIADCLPSINELVTAQTQKIEALKSHKKGLMQQLFPSVDKVEA